MVRKTIYGHIFAYCQMSIEMKNVSQLAGQFDQQKLRSYRL